MIDNRMVGEPMRFGNWLGVGVVMFSAVSAVRAEPRRIIGDPSRDVRQTMQARKLLADDPELAHLNIGVIVTDRGALLWGPVPSGEAAFRAELCLRTMVELVEVRSELFVLESLDLVRPPLKIDNPPQFLPELQPPELPIDAALLFGAPGLLTGQNKDLSRKRTAVKILPTEALRIPTANLENPKSEDLASAVRVFLQSKKTYDAVQFAIKEGSVYLQVTNQDSDALHEAARAIARLPNVQGVILVEKAR